ncbi:MAG: protease [Candidatus Dactylopiibacterium carminicum]|uniref:Protease n=1 Tax=Candidatus Dactylopiibacterium carminicum TaxID=857335 RepID=A0A272EW00_9RHOO|nr:S8 family serine peptidase [Candidatus Dactylopiibacterium carminicum]KAF7599519.1 protease [Candidatus Dactylopiibacterium carminicum]PAS94287.1 MAG: protease [Candidatus Dactylopiibacterium carminicum]PAS98483.1 MAG: protease [Candidatus Dactylopiibacterium carminicum]PAS99525.1 MAG: hypothetical protein BSR46_07575 [Candidatus Dactylopiibacterium carminicum]
MNRTVRLAAFVICAQLFAACGGGGGESSTGAASSTSAGHTLSGGLELSSVAVLDSDTNDPQQTGRTANDSPEQAQVLSTPALLTGTLNLAGVGPQGANQESGDPWDVFLTHLAVGQTVSLSFTGSVSGTDLDLYLVNAETQEVVGFSASENASSTECISAGAAGDYYVVANAYAGAARYTLSISAEGEQVSCPTVSSSKALFVSTQLLSKPRDSRAGALRVAEAARHRPPVLIDVPGKAALSSAGMRPFSRQDGTGLRHGASADTAIERGINTLVYAKRLRAGGEYAFVEPNYLLKAHAFAPNDPLYVYQSWHYAQIKLPAARTRLSDAALEANPRPLVAVIDDGIVRNHTDLSAQIEDEYAFISLVSAGDGNSLSADDPSTAADDPLWHGTHVAGTIAALADNSLWGLGVAPMAKLMPLRVFQGENATTYDVLQAIYYAAGLQNNSGRIAARRADVLNMSLGAQGSCPMAIADAVAQARAQGVVVVASSGNDGLNAVGMPANCAGVIAVGATDAAGRRTDYSNAGSALDVMAPGGDSRQSLSGFTDYVYSTVGRFSGNTRQPSFGGLIGTSMAAPHVSGVLALMRYANPDITVTQIDTLLALGRLSTDLGSSGWDAATGYGLIDADKAVSEALALRVGSETLAGVLQVSPAQIHLGSTVSTTTFTIEATEETAETVSAITSAHPGVRVEAVDVDAAGLGSYRVSVDRSRMSVGSNSATIQIQTSARTLTVTLNVIRLLDMGSANASQERIRVFALRAADSAVLATTDVHPERGTYSWRLTNIPAGEVRILASSDVDNNGLYCEAGEACGVYSSGSSLTVNGARSGLAITLDLSGTPPQGAATLSQ